MEQFRIFASIAAAIFIEAMPFLAVGALLSGAIEVLIPSQWLVRRIPKRLFPGISLGIAAGLVLPTCECGVVPVVRRLVRKGVPPHIAIAYMLAAPILNPVVLVSTYVAFRGSLLMLLSRAVVAAFVAGIIGAFVWRVERANGNSHKFERSDHFERSDQCERSVRNELHNYRAFIRSGLHEHEDGNNHEHGHTTDQRNNRRSVPGIAGEVLRHGAHDFLDMGKFLILGAMASAAFKTFLPQVVFDTLGSNMVLSVGGMMVLAFLLSVCSEADAFVAVSFAGIPSAAHLAFITYGPMLDLKLIGMYASTFRRTIFLALIIGPTIMVFVLSLIHGMLF